MPNLKDKPFQSSPAPSNYLVMVVDPVTGAVKKMTVADFLSQNIAPDTTPPSIVSATVLNGTTIRVIFSEIISAGTIAGWSTKKNGTNNPIVSVLGVGSATLDFTVTNTIVGGDTILISYNPAAGGTTDGSGNEANTITDYNVTNGLSGGGGVTLSTPSLTVSVISSTQINLYWTDVANESSYMLEWSPNGTSGWTQIGGTIAANTTTYNHTGLTASTAYYYRVKAVGDGSTYIDSGYGTGNGTTSASGSTQLSTPGSFATTVASSSQINLYWTDVANESSYMLEWSPNGTSGWTQIGGTIAAGTTSFNHTGLTASTAYYYRLKAVGNGTTFTDSNFATANATTSAGSSFVNITSWTSLTDTTVSSNNLTAGTTATAKAVSTNFLAANTEGRVRFTVTKVGGKAGILALSETTAAEDYTQVDYGIYVDSNNVGYITPETATVNSGVAATDGDVLEIERKLISGNYRLLIKHSTNGGTSFTTIYTSTTFNANILYVKFTSPFYDAVRCDDIKGENIS